MVKIKELIVVVFMLFIGCINTADAQFYNGTQVDFGKNRIQYVTYKWEYFRLEKFDTYFYKNGRELAAYVSESAVKNLKEIEDFYDFQLDSRIQFIIYNKQSDFRQSNLGLSSEPTFNLGGSNKIAGSKIIIYNEGDHKAIEKQIRMGLAEIVFNQMLYGGSWKDMVKNSALITVPEWYSKGLYAYLADDWNAKTQDILKDAIVTKKYTNLSRLSGNDAAIAGQSLWRYIADNYGKSVLSNVVYMTTLSRNIESGFNFVLGVSLKQLNIDWKNYYAKEFNVESNIKPIPNHEAIVKKTKKTRQYSQFKISPDGKYASFVTNEMGQLKLFVYDVEKDKLKRIYKAEKKLDRLNDLSYPIIAWHPSSKLLTYIFEKKGEVNLTYFNMETKKKETRPPLYNFEKILDFSYGPDGKTLVMSAVQKGQTDIFVYNLTSNFTEQITKDIYDDLTPRFMPDGRQIIFASNRVDDTIRFTDNVLYKKLNKKNDLFLYDYKSKSKLLRRYTDTPNINESEPYPYEKLYVTYLGENNNLTQRYVAKSDSSLSYVDTTEHYRYFSISKLASQNTRSIFMHHVNANSNKLSEIYFYKNRYHLLTSTLKPFDEISLAVDGNGASNITDKDNVTSSVIAKNAVTIVPIKIDDNRIKPNLNKSNSIDINNYIFDSEKIKSDSLKNNVLAPVLKPDTVTINNYKPATAPAGTGVLPEEFVLPKQRTYFRTYSKDQFVTQFDNGFLNNGYQRFTGSEVYFNPGINGLIKFGLSDVFEDYRVVGGFKLGFDFKSNEVFLSAENRSKRVDKQLLFYRQSLPSGPESGAPKQLSHQLRYSLKYPFNELTSLRFSLTGRYDRTTYLATDDVNLKRPSDNELWGIGKLEYIYDDTRTKGINIYYGLRYKVFAEYFNRIDNTEQNMTVVGFDIRKYIKIHRNLIWANRLAASTSFGTQKLVYYLGGVDNWLNIGSNTPTFNKDIQIAQDQNYAYQALATNMRGFSQNIRNGKSFAVLNSEVRWPIFSYLVDRPIKSEFVNAFQLIAFGDIGSAWNGTTPYSENNSYNTQIIKDGNISITIQKQQEPIVGGYGFGMRSKLFGYFVRADWAWGVQDGEVKPRIFYLSLSLDF